MRYRTIQYYEGMGNIKETVKNRENVFGQAITQNKAYGGNKECFQKVSHPDAPFGRSKQFLQCPFFPPLGRKGNIQIDIVDEGEDK